jgi:hypothetical protein
MISFSEMYEAVDSARKVLDNTRSYINKMASMILMYGNMRQIDSSKLNQMKKELRNWDMVKREWKR